MKFTIQLEGFPTDTVEVSHLDGKPLADYVRDKAKEIAWDKYKDKHLRKDGVRIPAPGAPVIEEAE